MSKVIEENKDLLASVEEDLEILRAIYEGLKAGRLSVESFVYKRRLSFKAVKSRGLSRCRNSVVSHPALYAAYASIKRYVEGLEEPIDGVIACERYADLIAKIQALIGPHGTMSNLSSSDMGLYREALACPHWPIVKRFVSQKVRPDFFYWSDRDLIDEAGKYLNLTQLKVVGGQLHRELAGRDLLNQVILKYPSYSTHVYIGLAGKRYRSQGELIFGNLIVLSALDADWDWQVETGLYRKGSSKPMTADFRLKTIDLFIEISMFKKNGRGSLGKYYEARRNEKQEIYAEEGINCLFIDSSGFYVNGFIDSEAFARHCIFEIRQFGYNCFDKSGASYERLRHFEGVDSKPELSAIAFLDYLEHEYGLTHKAQLSNDRSYLRPAILLRNDCDEVLAILKSRGFAIRSKKQRKAHQLKREGRALFAGKPLACNRIQK